MCGISVLFKKNGISLEFQNKFLNSISLIQHRGPDGEGVLQLNSATAETKYLATEETPPEFKSMHEHGQLADFDILMGHRRLSIIDTSVHGHQPMQYGHLSMVFNGEIYNYIELREELKGFNCQFKTNCDSEVILAAYQIWGPDCVNHFNGMFSVVIFDSLKRQLFIANDRFGVKPLYYFINHKGIFLVSEVKQIFALDHLKFSLNHEAIDDFLYRGFINTSEETIFNEIKRFPKAHYSLVSVDNFDGKIDFNCYYQIGEQKQNLHHDVDTFKALLTNAVNLRLRSDVPIGFASSGGLDSSSILYLAHHILVNKGSNYNVNTFSAIFPGLDGDESSFIKLIEDDLKPVAHYCNPLQTFSISDFEKQLYHQDFPVGTTSFYAEWAVARMVNQAGVKVLLVGQGGDELLGGYHHHFYRYCRQLILQGKIIEYLSQVKSFSNLKQIDVNKIHHTVLNDLRLGLCLRIGLIKLSNSLEREWNKANRLLELLKIDLQKTMLPSYLHSDDRDSMAFSLETRHPFLDYRMVDYCFNMPDKLKIEKGWQKNILRNAMAEMPDAIRYRKDKKGYTTPEKKWLEEYKDDFETYLAYLPEKWRVEPTAAKFRHFALGAWFKVNEISKIGAL